jgi:hypothetical protein
MVNDFMTNRTDKDTQEKHPFGLVVDWLEEGQICTMTATQNTRDGIDEWVKRVKEVNEQWPKNRMVLILYDIRTYSLTPYLRKRAQEMVEEVNPDLPERVAIVLGNDSIFGRGTRMFAKFLLQFINNADSQLRVFSTPEEGLAWLKTFLPAPQGSPSSSC